MGIRPSVRDKNCNVDMQIGSDYDTVKKVADHLDMIEAINVQLPHLYSYLGAHDTPPSTRLDGSPIESGDYYLNDVTDTFNYADLSNPASITWLELDPDKIKDYMVRAEAAAHEAESSKAAAAVSGANAVKAASDSATALADAVAAKDQSVASAAEAKTSEDNSRANMLSSQANATNANASELNAAKSLQDTLAAQTAAETAKGETEQFKIAASNSASIATDQVSIAKDEVTKATAQAGIAATKAQEAAASAVSASNNASDATAQANRAKAEADRASQITGLSTVDAAVQDALERSYQYAMTKTEFDASREANKELYAGSGFVEWGKHFAPNINQGLWSREDNNGAIPNSLFYGRTTANPAGVSKTLYPIVSVDGSTTYVQDTLPNSTHACSVIKFPPAPNGTKTYDSSTGTLFDFATQVDPKYGDVAADVNEAVARAFEGNALNGDLRLGTQHWSVIGGDASDMSVADNVMTLTVSTTANSYIRCNTGYASSNSNYLVEYEIISIDSARFGYSTFGGVTVPRTVGKHSVVVKPTGSNPFLSFGTYTNSVGSTLKISNVSIRPVTNQIITTRKDLVFLEVWHEDISEKGVIFPFGNVQYGSTTWEGVSVADCTLYGVQQSYCAFGEFDTATKGNCKPMNTSDTAGLAKLIQDPRNNIYFDSETKKLMQVRYRIRVIEGLGDEWLNVTASAAQIDFAYSIPNSAVAAKGSKDTTPDFVNNSSAFKYTYGRSNPVIGEFVVHPSGVAGTGNARALPIALVQRMNQGAYHPTYNPMGCARWQDYGVTTNEWYSPLFNGKPFSAKNALTPAAKAGDFGYNIDSGSMGSSKGSGRTDNDIYKFYDVIYAGQVEDLRLSAHKQDTAKLLTDSIRKAVSGEMRGKGKVPFTRMFNSRWSGSSVSGLKEMPVGITDEERDLLGGSIGAVIKVGDPVAVLDITRTAWQPCVITKLGDSVSFSVAHVDGTSALTRAAKDAGHIYMFGTYTLTPEFDELPWTDIVGSPANIIKTFPKGVIGQWVPDVTNTNKPANRKINGQPRYTYTDDFSATWKTGNAGYDTVKNTVVAGESAGNTRVNLIQYSTLSKFTESANSSFVVGNVGDVSVTSRNEVSYGNRLQGSLTGLIGKWNNSGATANLSMTAYNLWDIGTLATTNMVHTPVPFATPTNNSPAVKALSTLTEKDGLLYLQLHGNELKYDKKAIQKRVPAQSMNLNVGDLIMLSGFDNIVVNGQIWQVTKSLTGAWNADTLDRIIYADSKGTLYLDDGSVYGNATLWDGTSWGDDSTIKVIDTEGTKVDLNGNTVKTFCHHTMIPLGIVDYSSSAQSSTITTTTHRMIYSYYSPVVVSN